MRITWKELKEMIESEGVCDDTQIVVKVRNNSTEDYSENNIRAFLNDNGVLIIQDEFSF